MVNRKKIKYSADPSRVILRFFYPGNKERASRIIKKILSMEESDVCNLLEAVFNKFKDRHRNFEDTLLINYKKALLHEESISKSRALLIGSYFSHEYSIESAALFNPSIVPHPDQTGLNESELRYIMSLRATGEGHISSIEFRSGMIDRMNRIHPDEPTKYVSMAAGRNERVPTEIEPPDEDAKDANYDIYFTGKEPISERVIFPFSKTERNGIEDARFVLFTNPDGTSTYYGTFTAYDGFRILPQLIQTDDFVTFKIRTLQGNMAKDKGIALFPEKINNKYVMISRVDGENLYIMESDNIYTWSNAELLKKPELDWELVQLGNCGSPLKTDKGWILITHSVGPMRRYVISAVLLDLENPKKIIGTLKEPLLEPLEEEREGYVPNVVYSCGSLIHNGEIIIPYAMSDTSSSIASVSIEKLFSKFIPVNY